MMPTLAGVDVPEKLLALVSRYALQSDAVWATLVQVTILDAVSRMVSDFHGLLGEHPQIHPYNSFLFSVLSRKSQKKN
jgi:hypothetical protein